MTHISYPYNRLQSWRYGFVSDGKRKIQKIVDFAQISTGNIVNLGFGDLLPDGSIDDKVNSNNGDILKVLTTVANILKDFTTLYPDSNVLFSGSTDERTRIYNRILKMYYPTFKKDFSIAGAIMTYDKVDFVPYDPKSNQEYLAFLIKKIS